MSEPAIREFPLSAEVREQFMQDVLTQLEDVREEDEEFTFEDNVRSFYDNLMDDLHDSRGDQEYQEGVLERMQFVEQYLGKFLNYTFSARQKLDETPWATPETEGSDA